ncbi:MAG: prohibitin family protein [Candidatus Gracilibacteria bacterium]|nr:prohibitin family protein [Candidatus Gracilibacteria bacterium]
MFSDINNNVKTKGIFVFFKYIIILIVVFIIFSILNPLVVIQAGQRGIVFSKFGGVKSLVLGEGIHFRIPLIESIVQMDVRTQKLVFTNDASKYPDIGNIRGRLDSASSDLQDVYVDVIVTYSLEKTKAAKIYQDVGLDYESKKIIPAVINSVKTHTAKFKVAEILTNREKIKSDVELELTKILDKDGIKLEGVSLANFDFNPDFKKSIEEKQITEQKKEKEKYELERVAIQAQQKVKQAEADSQSKITIAEGEKKAKILEGEAVKEYNILIAQGLSKDVLEYKKLENTLKSIDKWSGVYPNYYMGGENSPIPLINIGKE